MISLFYFVEIRTGDTRYIQQIHIDQQSMHPSLFVCFVALRPKSTAMVIAGRSVHLTTLFPGQA